MARGSVIGFEIGNEPDIYNHRFWLATVSAATPGARLLPRALSATTYTDDFRSFAAALGGSRHRFLWSGRRSQIRVSTQIESRASLRARVLGERASAGMAHSVKPVVILAHRAGLPFRLTELNSVTCGGRLGVSDAFATALWAPDALSALLQTGVDGVNVHVRTGAITVDLTKRSWLRAGAAGRERRAAAGALAFRSA